MRIMETIIKSLTQEFDDPKTGALAVNSVLIAEDDPIFRRILESWFKRWDYQVTAYKMVWTHGRSCKRMTPRRWRCSIG